MVDFTLANLNDIKKINENSEICFPMDAVCMCGKQGDALLMWFVFRMSGEEVEVLDIYAVHEDDKLLFFCGKAGLNALDLSNFKNIFCKNEKRKAILLKLGFVKKEDRYTLTLTDDYFKAGCCKQ